MCKIVFSDVDTKKIIHFYMVDKMSRRSIALFFGVSTTVIARILTENSIKTRTTSETSRRYEIDDHFFDVIDTEEKAYFFGLLYADGCNIKCKHIKLSLHKDDINIVSKMSDLVCGNKKRIIKKDKNNMCSLHLTSKHMAETLNAYGMVPRKSLIKTFPEVILQSDEDIIRHFIRGYFDGNGTLCIMQKRNARKEITVGVTSTLMMCESINKILSKYCNIEKLSIYKHGSAKSGMTYVTKTSMEEKCLKILKWMYSDSNYYLERKYNIYQSLIMP